MSPEEELQSTIQTLIGEYGWLLASGVVLLLFRSAIEGIVEGLKIFMGNDLNTDDVVHLDGRPARVVRVGMFKTIFFIYYIGCTKGKPYVKGGTKLQVQNTELKNHNIEKPLSMLDLTFFESECEEEDDDK